MKQEEKKINQELGRRLATLRELKDITRPKLAEMIDVEKRSLERYERGEHRIPASVLVQCCTILKTNPTFFINVAADSESISPEEFELLKELRGRDIRPLLDFVKTQNRS